MSTIHESNGWQFKNTPVVWKVAADTSREAADEIANLRTTTTEDKIHLDRQAARIAALEAALQEIEGYEPASASPNLMLDQVRAIAAEVLAKETGG